MVVEIALCLLLGLTFLIYEMGTITEPVTGRLLV